MSTTKSKKSERDFFSGEYSFTGIHADYVKKLTSSIIAKGKYIKEIKLFEYNHKIYTEAPMVGFLYKRKADKDIGDKGNEDNSIAKISEGQIIRYADRAQEVMKLILLLDKEYEPDEQRRIDKAFRYFCEDENDFRLFEDYMRGGIEIMYEKIIGESTDPYEIAGNLVTFLDDVKEMFNDQVGDNDILQLCENFKKREAKKSRVNVLQVL